MYTCKPNIIIHVSQDGYISDSSYKHSPILISMYSNKIIKTHQHDSLIVITNLTHAANGFGKSELIIHHGNQMRTSIYKKETNLILPQLSSRIANAVTEPVLTLLCSLSEQWIVPAHTPSSFQLVPFWEDTFQLKSTPHIMEPVPSPAGRVLGQ